MRLRVPAKIFVPAISSPAKIARIEGYGAEIVVGGATYAEALAASRDWATRSGAFPSMLTTRRRTIHGAGTTAMEFESQAGELDTLIAAVGGGGFLSGIAAWHGEGPNLIAAEPENAPTLHAALAAGKPVDVAVSGVAADSLGAKRIGEANFPILQRHVTRSLLVSDDDIRAAQKALWDGARILAEPGGAAAFAVLLSKHYVPRTGERLGVFVCGANTTAVDFSR